MHYHCETQVSAKTWDATFRYWGEIESYEIEGIVSSEWKRKVIENNITVLILVSQN